MDKIVKEIDEQLAILNKFKKELERKTDILSKHRFSDKRINDERVKQEVMDVFTELSRLYEVDFGIAIAEYGEAIKKGNEKEIIAKEKKMEEINTKISRMEESFLAREKELLEIDRNFKERIDVVRFVHNFSKELDKL